MSLDFYLKTEETRSKEQSPQIFVRRDGQTVQISRKEWDHLHPGQEPVTVYNEEEPHVCFSANITHNLAKMANEAGIYQCLWHPEENSIQIASEMIVFLEMGLARLQADPRRFKQFNPENGWGTYESLIRFTETVLIACKKYPTAMVETSR